MKSLQIRKHIPAAEQAHYSNLGVMSSAAGYYVGTYYKAPSSNFTEPGSRDTDYFATAEDAMLALEILERLDKQTNWSASMWADKEEFITCTFDGILHSLGLNPRNVGYRIDP